MQDIEIKIATLDDVDSILEINHMTGNLHEDNVPNYFIPSTPSSGKSFIENAIKSEYSEVFIAKTKIKP